MLEADSFHPARSGGTTCACSRLAGGIPPARVDEVLATVELSGAARRNVGGYSLGMRQRSSVAGALLGLAGAAGSRRARERPRPGRDPLAAHFLRSFAAGGGTVLISSHVLAEVAQFVNEVVIIHRGRLVAHEPLETLMARAAAGRVVGRPEASRLREALAEAGIEATATSPRRAARRGAAGAGGRGRRRRRDRPA